jgi:hypothetical protein
MLLAVIAVSEIILHELQLPNWPVFFVMMFFFLAHTDKNAVPNIIIGALVGIGCFVIARPIIVAMFPVLGLPTARMLYLLVVVGVIVLFREMVPMALNDYTFAFFLLSGMASRARSHTSNNPLVWMLLTLVGGTILILAILGIRKIVVVIETSRARKARKAAANGSLPQG